MDRSMQTPNSDEGVPVLRRADPGRRDRLPVLRQRRGSARYAPKEWRAQDDRALAGQDWYNLDPRIPPLAVEIGRSSRTSFWAKVEESFGPRTSWRARGRGFLQPLRQ